MRDSIGIYICKAQKCPLLGRPFLDSFASGGGGREKTLEGRASPFVAQRQRILFCINATAAGPCGESGGTPSSTFAVGEQASTRAVRLFVERHGALSLNHQPRSISSHPAPSASAFRTAASHIASDGQCTRPHRPSLSLLLAASRQFILHDANQAFVLIYAAVHSSARAATRPLATKSPLSLLDDRDAVIVMGVTPPHAVQWRVSPTDFYGGLLPSHSYILRLLNRTSVKK